MKTIIMTMLLLFFFTSCSKVKGANPSQNEALNSVAGNTKNKEDGFMQKALDSWLENEWTPATQKNEEIKKIDKDENRNFTLQEYINKMELYNKDKNSTQTDESHIKRIDSMPVIGNN